MERHYCPRFFSFLMHSGQNRNIKECFQSFSEGDAIGFEMFFDAYKTRVFRLAVKMLKSEAEAEEIVQDVFLSIWTARERLNKIGDPEAYLFTVTYNAIYKRLKKISRSRELLQSVLSNLIQSQNTTEETVSANEIERLMHEAIRQLPPQQRAVYELNKEEGLSYREIAEHLHLSPNTVRNHLAEAMKAIRLFLKKWSVFFVFIAGFFFK